MSHGCKRLPDESLHIPDDLIACQSLLVEQARAIVEQGQKITTLQQQVEEQQLTINELLQRAFRHRSERYLEDPKQLKLDFGETPEVADAAAGLADAVEEAQIVVAAYKRRKRKSRKPRNEKLPEHLPRYEVEAPVPDAMKRCAEHGERKLIGYDRVETLEFERPKLKVRVTLYPKLVCEGEPACGVAQPPREPGLVEGNRYGTSVAAEIVTGKCGYHLPIYREQDYFAGCGWTADRSTLLNIFRASAELVRPLALYLRKEVLASGAIGTDETRVTLLLPEVIPMAKEGDAKSRRIHEVFTEAQAAGRKSVSGRMWAYRSVTVPINVFDFTVSRHRDGPDDVLVACGFVGKLLGDCYSGYQGITLRSDSRIVRAACNAHARRKIFDVRETYPLLSSQFLAMYQELYDIEQRAKTLTVSGREELRDREARPVWQRMRHVARQQGGLGSVAEGQVRRSVRVSPQPVGRLAGVPGRRPAADRQQRDGAVDEADRDRSKELALPGKRGGRRADRRSDNAGLQRAAQRPGRMGVRQGRVGSVARRQQRLRCTPPRPLGRLASGAHPRLPRRRASRPRRRQALPLRSTPCRQARPRLSRPHQPWYWCALTLKIDLGTGTFNGTSTTAATGLTYQNAGSPTTSQFATIDISLANNVSSLAATLPGDDLTLGQIRDFNAGIGSIAASAGTIEVAGINTVNANGNVDLTGDRQPHGRCRRHRRDRHGDDLAGRGRQRGRHGRRRRGHALDWGRGHGHLDQPHGQRHHAPRGGHQHRHQRQPGRGRGPRHPDHHAHRHPHRAE